MKNITEDYYNSTSTYYVESYIFYELTFIVSIGLPLTLVAIYAVYSLVRNDQVVPVYVVNLLISDVIQLCCMAVWMTKHREPFEYGIVNFMYSFGLFSSVCFMVCIAFQRYLVIACPLWYRFRRNLKTSLVVCVLVWALNFVFGFTFHYFNSRIIAFFFFFPLPLFIFFLGGTLKSLSASLVPSDEKRRIVGILVLVLLIYTLMFLPIIILFTFQINIFRLSSVLLKLSPLADLFLYVFMRKGIADKLLASVCCCRMDNNDHTVNDDTQSVS